MLQSSVFKTLLEIRQKKTLMELTYPFAAMSFFCAKLTACVRSVGAIV